MLVFLMYVLILGQKSIGYRSMVDEAKKEANVRFIEQAGNPRKAQASW